MKLLATLLLFTSNSALGAQATNAQIDEILKLSGTKDRLSRVAVNIKKNMRARASYYPAGVAEKLEKGLLKAFNSKKLHNNIRKNLQSKLTKKDAKAALAWFRSPLGKKVVRLNSAPETDKGKKELEAFMKASAKTPPSQERIELAKKVIALTHASKMLYEQTLSVTKGILEGANSIMPKGQKLTRAQMKQQMDQMAAILKPQMEQATLLVTVFAYRKLSKGEYESYIGFLSRGSGQRYTKAMAGAMGDVLKGAASKTKGHVSRSVASKKRKKR